MNKYRYFMSGMFEPTDGEIYEINIPSPRLHNSENEALQDERFGYRFLLLDETEGPIIVVYENEKFELDDDKKHLSVWTEGNVVGTYTFEEFMAANGYMRMLKPEKKSSSFIDGDTDFLNTDKTFRDVFPGMKKGKTYYIDSEAYYIEKIEDEQLSIDELEKAKDIALHNDIEEIRYELNRRKFDSDKEQSLLYTCSDKVLEKAVKIYNNPDLRLKRETIRHERSESDISFYEVTNALLAWLGFISIHININNLEEVACFLAEEQMFICPYNADVVVYARTEPGKSYGCDVYICSLRTSIVFENQNAIKKFLLLVEDPNILVNQETVGSIDGVKITTN